MYKLSLTHSLQLLALHILKRHSTVTFSFPLLSVSFSFFCSGGFLKSVSSFACRSAGAQRCHLEHHGSPRQLGLSQIPDLSSSCVTAITRFFTTSRNWFQSQFELVAMIQCTVTVTSCYGSLSSYGFHSDKPINTQCLHYGLYPQQF